MENNQNIYVNKIYGKSADVFFYIGSISTFLNILLFFINTNIFIKYAFWLFIINVISFIISLGLETKYDLFNLGCENSPNIKISLRYSIIFLLMAFVLLILPTLIIPTCFSTFSGGCGPSLKENLISMFSYFLGFTFGIIGAIYLRKHHDLVDANKKKPNQNK